MSKESGDRNEPNIFTELDRKSWSPSNTQASCDHFALLTSCAVTSPRLKYMTSDHRVAGSSPAGAIVQRKRLTQEMRLKSVLDITSP